jgi:hypothetical protein
MSTHRHTNRALLDILLDLVTVSYKSKKRKSFKHTKFSKPEKSWLSGPRLVLEKGVLKDKICIKDITPLSRSFSNSAYCSPSKTCFVFNLAYSQLCFQNSERLRPLGDLNSFTAHDVGRMLASKVGRRLGQSYQLVTSLTILLDAPTVAEHA